MHSLSGAGYSVGAPGAIGTEPRVLPELLPFELRNSKLASPAAL